MTKLGSVISDIVDCEHKTAPLDDQGEYFAVGTPAMAGNVINYSQARRISRDTFVEWTRRLTPKVGDLLLAREAPVGPVVEMPAAENVAPGQRTVLMRPDSHVVDRKYLYYALSTPDTQTRLKEKAAGSTVAHLNVADIRSFEFPWVFPAVAVQQAIAEVLGALDDKIAANKAVALTSESLLSAKLRSLQTDADCEAVRLDELVELNPRRSAPTAAEPAYLDMQKLPTSGSQIFDWGRRAARGGARFTNGDTVLARITPCLENRKVGFVDFLKPGETGIGSTEFVVLRSRHGLATPLSFLLAVDEGFRSHAIQHMVGSSGRQRVAASNLASYEFNLPRNRGSLVRLGELATTTFELLASQRNESRHLANLRDTLLPHLMSGRITVREAEKQVEEAL